MEIAWLPEPEAHPLWSDIVRLLEPATLEGFEVYEAGKDWVWLVYEGPVLYAAGITRLYGDGEVELRQLGGRKFRDWLGLYLSTIEQWARDGGAHRMTLRGRKGWVRFARTFGWVFLGFDDAGHAMFERNL